MKYLDIIKHNWQTIILVVLGFVVLSLAISLIQPFEYKSRVEFLIVQKQTLTMDAYAATRASEKVASNLASVVKTKSFFDKVVNSSLEVRRSDFPRQEDELRQAWQKKISTQVFPETSILVIDVFDRDKKEANIIASAVASVLVSDSAEYHGGGSDVSIKVINEPLVSNRPTRPNIVLNLLAGLVLGLILSSAWVFYKHDKSLEVEDLVTEIQAETEMNPEMDTEDYRREQVKNIFEPRVHTMYDDYGSSNK